MKQYICFILCLLILVSCSPIEKVEEKTEPVSTPEIESSNIIANDAVKQQNEVLPIRNSFETNWTEVAYNSSFADGFIYSPYDDCFYISLGGENMRGIGVEDAASYPFDPPQIERFCKMNAKTGEVKELLNHMVGNLVYSNDYVYFSDEGKIKRIKNNEIEEVFTLSEPYPNSFHIEKNYLYLISWRDGVYVFNLENMEEIKNMRYYINDEAFYQIYDGTIYSFSENGFYWRKGANEINSYKNAYNLINNFYVNDRDTHPLRTAIRSFVFDGNLLVETWTELFLINPETDEIEIVASDADGIGGYTIHGDYVYYISGDALYTYNIETKETDMIIAFLENDDDRTDYYGYENLRNVKFLDDRCFLYMSGFTSYSYKRVAELDLDSKNVVYLTNYFDDKINTLTSFYRVSLPFSFEYPNDYSVFVDYGSSGGTIISNYENRIRIGISYMGMSAMDIKNASKDATNQGFPIYYIYNETDYIPFKSVIRNNKTDENYIRIDIFGDLENIKRNEDEILGILKSIYGYWYENDN